MCSNARKAANRELEWGGEEREGNKGNNAKSKCGGWGPSRQLREL